jgi:hypothetical protein
MFSLTAIISGILGIVSASIPKAFDLAEKKLTFAQEMAIRKMEAEAREKEQQFALQAKAFEAQAKMEESYYEAVAKVDANAREHAEQLFAQLVKPSGYAFLDALNAAIRPLTTVIMLSLFVTALVSWMYGVGAVNDEFGKQMGALFYTCVEGIIFFVFGARQVQKPGTLLK